MKTPELKRASRRGAETQSTAKKRAEELLGRIKILTEEVRATKEKCLQATAAIEAETEAALAPIMAELSQRDKEIKELMAEKKDVLFAASNIVNLRLGSLIREIAVKVSIPRDALAMIEEQGWMEAVRIARSVDREVVEQWPEERLDAIGARRRTREEFTYNIKGVDK